MRHPNPVFVIALALLSTALGAQSSHSDGVIEDIVILRSLPRPRVSMDT
jgi:hypothetical protein